MSANIIEIGAADFPREVLEAPLAVVDFYSTECPPCEALAGKFEALSEAYGDHVKFVKIFRQQNRELAKTLDVSGSPTLLFFQNGKAVGPKLTGGILRSSIKRQLDSMLPPETVRKIDGSIVPKTTETDVLILGGGPSGLTAGIYLAQAHVRTIVADTALPGGFVATTHQVSNFPGFIEPLNGYMLSHQITEQAKANGVEFRAPVEISAVDLEAKTAVIDGFETIRAKRIIVATGSSPKPLGAAGEKELIGQGISYCATCDAKYYEGKDVVVVGGGNSAIEESLFIAKFARKVTILHRSEKLRANKASLAKAEAEPRIEFLLHTKVKEIRKRANMDLSLTLEDVRTGTVSELAAAGVFIFIGFLPNLNGLGDKLTVDQWGYIETDSKMRTNVTGVFAAGDVTSKHYRQITTAVADGTVAAMAITAEIA
jgi:thioredoxin reductase (NADPH)